MVSAGPIRSDRIALYMQHSWEDVTATAVCIVYRVLNQDVGCALHDFVHSFHSIGFICP